jgi:hypothetical protein
MTRPSLVYRATGCVCRGAVPDAECALVVGRKDSAEAGDQ